MPLGETPFHRPACPVNLPPLLASGLGEHRQQDDPPPWCDPIGDPHRLTGEKEAQFSELAVELFGVGFIEKRSIVGQPVDVEVDATLIVIAEGEVPIADLGFEFDLAPRYSAYAIPPLRPGAPRFNLSAGIPLDARITDMRAILAAASDKRPDYTEPAADREGGDGPCTPSRPLPLLASRGVV